MSAIKIREIFIIKAKSIKHCAVLLASTCLVVFGAGLNAAAEALDEEDFLDDLVPIVLTATRLAQPRHDVPGSISVIDRKMIERSGATEIPHLLRLVPGFQLAHDIDRIAVTYHGNSGIFSNRLQVLVDGRSVYTPVFGGEEWFDLPIAMEDIERLEIMRGPNGVTYGANSFQAVINIITRNPSVVGGSTAKITVGSAEHKRFYARHAGALGDSRYRINVESYSNSGFDNTHDDTERNGFNFRDELRLSEKDLLDISAGYVHGLQGMGSSDITEPIRHKSITYHYQQFRWKRSYTLDDELSIQFYHNYHELDDDFDVQVGTGPAVSPYSLSNTMDRYNLELQRTQRISPELRMVYGGEVRLDTVKSPDLGWFSNARYNSVSNNLYRLFVNNEWLAIDSLLVNVGVMYEHNDLVGSDISPRLALNYRYSKNKTLRFVASKATRTPSIIETSVNGVVKFDTSIALVGVIDIPFIGSENLLPETITSFEVGYFSRYPAFNATTDLRVYKEKISNRIQTHLLWNNSAFPASPVDALYSNNGAAEIVGIDYELRYTPNKKTSVVLAYAYAKQTGQDLTDIFANGVSLSIDTGNTTPKNTLSLLVGYEFPRHLAISAGVYHVDKMSWYDANTVGPQIDGYTTLDLRVAKDFNWHDMKGKAELVLQNANGDYVDFHTSVEINRIALLSIGLQF